MARERNLSRRSLIVLLLGLLWTLPAWADSPLVGLDRNEQASPWKAVGRLDSKHGYCTATLIAPDLVLSAAHCTFDDAGVPMKASELTFRAGFRNGAHEAERQIIQIARPDAYVYRDTDLAKRIANDVVLLRLDKVIPTHVIAPFVVEPRIMRQGEVSVVSYGRGRENLPSLQQKCTVLDSFRSLMVMDCDTTFGSSGAPVFRREGPQIRIASVVSGYAMFKGVRRTTGMALPQLVTRLKAQMAAKATKPIAQARRIGVGTRTGVGAKFIRPNGS